MWLLIHTLWSSPHPVRYLIYTRYSLPRWSIAGQETWWKIKVRDEGLLSSDSWDTISSGRLIIACRFPAVAVGGLRRHKAKPSDSPLSGSGVVQFLFCLPRPSPRPCTVRSGLESCRYRLLLALRSNLLTRPWERLMKSGLRSSKASWDGKMHACIQ